MVNAVVYVRISRDSEHEGLGVKRQESDCRDLAVQLGWTVTEVYIDNDVSASKNKPRPAYQRMMRAVEAGAVEAVVVWDVDRLTRKPRELEDWIDHADAVALKLASVGGEIDLATPQGRAMARMKGTFARLEAETIARRQKRKHKELAENGRFNGPRPFGYDFATGEDGAPLEGAARTLVINPDEAAVVRECVERVLAGEAIWRVTNDLNTRGIKTTKGGQWHTQPLRRMLMRWTNAGYREHQPRKNERPDGPATLHPATWEPIVDRATHERVIAMLTDPARRTNKESTAVKYLLTSVARCGECGGKVVGAKEYTYTIKVPTKSNPERTKTRVYPARYQCPNAGCHKVTRKMADVDELVEAVVIGLLEREGVEVFGGSSRILRETETRIAELNAKLALLSDRWIDDRLTDDQFERQNARLRAQLGTLEQRRKHATPDVSMQDFIGPGAGNAWRNADVEKKRRVLRSLAEMIGFTVTIDKIGSGAFSNGAASRHAGIRIESRSASAPELGSSGRCDS